MSRFKALLLSAGVACLLPFSSPAAAQCPATVPAANGALPGPLPLFPSDNWWNTDISAAPVDPGSANFIAYINNGGTRRLHPDFGGTASPGSVDIYGMPYAIVDGSQPKQAVTFAVLGRKRRRQFGDGTGSALLPDSGAGDHAVALGGGRVTRQRRRARRRAIATC